MGLLYKQGVGSKTPLLEHSFTSLECIDVTFVARKNLRAIVVYRPPGGASVGVFLEEFSVLLQEPVKCPKELLMCGDFNFHMDNKANWNVTRFGELLDLFNLRESFQGLSSCSYCQANTCEENHKFNASVKIRNENSNCMAL